jgi:hypothetical protein
MKKIIFNARIVNIIKFQTAISSLNNRLVCVAGAQCAYCDVGAEP